MTESNGQTNQRGEKPKATNVEGTALVNAILTLEAGDDPWFDMMQEAVRSFSPTLVFQKLYHPDDMDVADETGKLPEGAVPVGIMLVNLDPHGFTPIPSSVALHRLQKVVDSFREQIIESTMKSHNLGHARSLAIVEQEQLPDLYARVDRLKGIHRELTEGRSDLTSERINEIIKILLNGNFPLQEVGDGGYEITDKNIQQVGDEVQLLEERIRRITSNVAIANGDPDPDGFAGG